AAGGPLGRGGNDVSERVSSGDEALQRLVRASRDGGRTVGEGSCVRRGNRIEDRSRVRVRALRLNDGAAERDRGRGETGERGASAVSDAGTVVVRGARR